VTVAQYDDKVGFSLLNPITANLEFLHALQRSPQILLVALGVPRKWDDV
jgi:hypothetical protein